MVNSCWQTLECWKSRVFTRQTSKNINLVLRFISSRRRKREDLVRLHKRSHVKCEFATSKNLAKKLKRIETSSICHQHVLQLLMPFTYANFSLSCDRRRRYFDFAKLIYFRSNNRNGHRVLAPANSHLSNNNNDRVINKHSSSSNAFHPSSNKSVSSTHTNHPGKAPALHGNLKFVNSCH